jgi:hypothetical protein
LSAPKPTSVYDLQADVARLLGHDKRVCGSRDDKGRLHECVGCLYAWVHGASHDRTVRDHVKTRGGGRSDPTGSVAGQKEPMRRSLAHAHRKLIAAYNSVDAAARLLEQALDRDGPTERNELLGERTASPVDLAAARRAQANRRAKGEAIP